MSRVIFNLENRGSDYIFHWFIYMVGGFSYIKDGGNTGHDSNIFEQNKHLFRLDMLKPPYNIYMINDACNNLERITKNKNNENNYILETFELLKNEFILIDKNDIKNDDIILNNYGAHIINGYYVSYDIYHYLKTLFENVIHITENDIIRFNDKKFYLCRSRAHLCASNIESNYGTHLKRRQIINEDELIKELKLYNIECIFLEDYSLADKIKLFKLASLIISPNSGGLTFSVFGMAEKLSIIEINVDSSIQCTTQYLDICKCFNINYTKVVATKLDSNDNMRVDVDIFINGLKNNNLI